MIPDSAMVVSVYSVQGLLKASLQRDQGIRRKPQNIQPVEVSGGVDHPLDNRLVQRAGETVVRSRFGDDR